MPDRNGDEDIPEFFARVKAKPAAGARVIVQDKWTGRLVDIRASANDAGEVSVSATVMLDRGGPNNVQCFPVSVKLQHINLDGD